MADVKDVTDRSNTAAALDFLDACRKRRQAEDAAKDSEDLPPSGSKVVFKKPKRTNPPTAAVEATKDPSDGEGLSYGLSCGNSKRVMPEAVVGRQNVKRKAASEDKGAADAAPAGGTKATSKKEKKLSHLSFDDEDDC